MQPQVFNIQKFSTHDGDGMRTTIFFKGCPLSCRWCHNPESQRFAPELVFYKERCTGCGECVRRCLNGANRLEDGRAVYDRSRCGLSERCVDFCVPGAREICGREYTVTELLKEAKKDQIFYEKSGGGVTLSGGEVMAQDMDFVEALCRRIHNEGISLYIDTSGFAPFKNFERLLPYVDVFLYDIKLMDPEKHRREIGQDNALILENLEKLSRAGAVIDLRIPLIDGVNADEDFLSSLISFLQEKEIRLRKLALLPYHDLGKSKYQNLGRAYEEQGMARPSEETLKHFKDALEKSVCSNIEIGG